MVREQDLGREGGRKEGRKDWVVGGGRQEEIREEERVWVEGYCEGTKEGGRKEGGRTEPGI